MRRVYSNEAVFGDISVTVGTSCYFLVMWGTLLLAFHLSRSFFFHISKYIYNVTLFFSTERSCHVPGIVILEMMKMSCE